MTSTYEDACEDANDVVPSLAFSVATILEGDGSSLPSIGGVEGASTLSPTLFGGLPKTDMAGFEGSRDSSPPRRSSLKDEVFAPEKAPKPPLLLNDAKPPLVGTGVGGVLVTGVEELKGDLLAPTAEVLPKTGIVELDLGGVLVGVVESVPKTDTGLAPTSLGGLKNGDSLLITPPNAPKPSAGLRNPVEEAFSWPNAPAVGGGAVALKAEEGELLFCVVAKGLVAGR